MIFPELTAKTLAISISSLFTQDPLPFRLDKWLFSRYETAVWFTSSYKTPVEIWVHWQIRGVWLVCVTGTTFTT